MIKCLLITFAYIYIYYLFKTVKKDVFLLSKDVENL